MLCPGCGNEVEDPAECPVCGAREARREQVEAAPQKADELQLTLCVGCGNMVQDPAHCPICADGRAARKAKSKAESEPRLCSKCGAELREPGRCPYCRRGTSPRKRRGRKPPKPPEPRPTGRLCPRCQESLEIQDWEGIPVLSCPHCRGSFFPLGGLEEVLDKVRQGVAPPDPAVLREEFKDRFKRKLPKAVRYKACPLCRTVMTRRNYGTVSGVIIDHCGDHGTWVDEANFGSLTEFVVRGGDELAKQVREQKTRLAPKAPKSSTPLDRLLGDS
ncbi:MAG: zf-TFIIB domain-containing protein [Planctomycetota bacterium]